MNDFAEFECGAVDCLPDELDTIKTELLRENPSDADLLEAEKLRRLMENLP